MPRGAQVTAHFKSLRHGTKPGLLNFELTRRQAEEWINVLSVGLVENQGKVLHFIIHEDMPIGVCRRGSCEGNAEGDFCFVRTY